MKLPRWTVYPALATLAILTVTAVPQRGSRPLHEGAAKRSRNAVAEKLAAPAEAAIRAAEREALEGTELAEEAGE